jgi:hypothetical protein
MLGPIVAFFAGVAFGKSQRGRTERPPSTATTKPTTTPPVEPSKVPWPQVGPRGGHEVPPAVQRKQGSEERKNHELAIAALKAERQQRMAELAQAGEDPAAQHAIKQRIADIDSEIAARQAAIAKLPA